MLLPCTGTPSRRDHGTIHSSYSSKSATFLQDSTVDFLSKEKPIYNVKADGALSSALSVIFVAKQFLPDFLPLLASLSIFLYAYIRKFRWDRAKFIFEEGLPKI
jgi:hypothetical protein